MDEKEKGLLGLLCIGGLGALFASRWRKKPTPVEPTPEPPAEPPTEQPPTEPPAGEPTPEPPAEPPKPSYEMKSIKAINKDTKVLNLLYVLKATAEAIEAGKPNPDAVLWYDPSIDTNNTLAYYWVITKPLSEEPPTVPEPDPTEEPTNPEPVEPTPEPTPEPDISETPTDGRLANPRIGTYSGEIVERTANYDVVIVTFAGSNQYGSWNSRPKQTQYYHTDIPITVRKFQSMVPAEPPAPGMIFSHWENENGRKVDGNYRVFWNQVFTAHFRSV